jgi:hypothetical protein
LLPCTGLFDEYDEEEGSSGGSGKKKGSGAEEESEHFLWTVGRFILAVIEILA